LIEILRCVGSDIQEVPRLDIRRKRNLLEVEASDNGRVFKVANRRLCKGGEPLQQHSTLNVTVLKSKIQILEVRPVGGQMHAVE
jgi:hypothetical protein